MSTQDERILKVKSDVAWPETWPWYRHDKESVYNIAKAICKAIDKDMKSAGRFFVPGLRMALRLLEDTYPFEVD